MANAPSFNRDVRDVIRIDPRVSLDREDAATGGSGQDRISCLGGNDRGNTFTVDGIAQSDIYGLNDTGFSSRSSTPIPYDAVRETQVQFAPFDVEYGKFTGCAINVVTKSRHEHVPRRRLLSNIRTTTCAARRSTAAHGRADRARQALGRLRSAARSSRTGCSSSAPTRTRRPATSQDDGPAGGGFPNEMRGVTVAAVQRDLARS